MNKLNEGRKIDHRSTKGEELYIWQSILPYESDDYKNLMRDDELLAYSAERIVSNRFSPETEAFLRSIFKELGR